MKYAIAHFSLVFLLTVFVPGTGFAQKHLQLLNENPSISIDQLLSEFEAWSRTTNPETARRHRKHLERWLIANQGTYRHDGPPVNVARQIWTSHQKYQTARAHIGDRSVNGDWIDYTPESYTNTGHADQGRIMCVALHPDDPNTIFVGAGSGGLWRSQDGGSTWEQLTKGLPVLGVSSIAIDHTDPDVIYILTGECDGRVNPSIGILKSEDGGASWQETIMRFDMDELHYGFKLLMHPTNPDTMLVATTNGIYRTFNGWFSMVPEGPLDFVYLEGTVIYDLEFRPGDPNWVYAASGTNVYRSNNLGGGWVDLTSNAAGLPNTPISNRIELAVAPTAPMRVYALHASDAEGNGYEGLYVSDDGGSNWIGKTDATNIVGAGEYNQSTYNLILEVAPWDEDQIFAGGIDLWNSNSAGDEGTWNWSNIGTHADKHCFMFNTIFQYLLCTDGGLEQSDNGGFSWSSLSDGLKIRQYYNLDVSATQIMAGSQDNGTALWTKGSATGQRVMGGDGFQPYFHPSDPNIAFCSTQEDRFRSTNGPDGPYHDISAAPHTGNIWTAPWRIHPFDHDTMYTGIKGGVLLRSFTGGDSLSWHPIDSMYPQRLISLAQGISNPNVMYAASATQMRKTSNVNSPAPTWDTITQNLPVVDSSVIREIAVNPSNVNRVWAVFENFKPGEKVYRTLNQGATWSNYSEGLPNVRVRAIVCDPGPNEQLYIGTDFGVFYRHASMPEWEYFSNGLPSVPVYDLKIEGGYLYAATHGNGIWRSDLTSPCPGAISLTPGTAPYGPGDSGTWIHEATQTITTSVGLINSLGTDITCRAGNFVRMDPGFEIQAGNAFEAKIGGCDN